MAKQPTIPVNVVDKSIPADDHSLIAIIEEPNPVTGYEINEQQLRQLIQLPQYWITDENGRTISGVNFYEYFPRGGGGRLPIVIEKTITENGVYMAVDDHADGYSKVTVNTPVPPPAPVLIEKTITEDGVYNPSDDDADGYNLVTVIHKPTGPSSVTFYDYDGSVVASYTPEQFAGLTELPANPTHEGLTAQGWNWSLSDAKEYVAENNCLDIGQMYVTDDGKTRLYITLPEGRISPILQLYLNDNSELDIDWGDGGTHSTFTSTNTGYKNERHNYATAGDYVIAITVTTGSFVLQSSSTNVSSILWNGNNNGSSPDSAYNNSVKKVEIGTGISSIGQSAFYSCHSLTSITIPNGITSISSNAFAYCYSLSSITIPDSVTSISASAFAYCYSLSSITIPDTVTSIGQNAFQNCSSLSSITIPDGVTSIGNNAFFSCYALASITIPDSVTSISVSAFYQCYSLSSITIPDGVTSISASAFAYCSYMESIIIGNSVTSIGSSAFYQCSYMESIKFTSTTPPTVSSGYAWAGVPTTCTILVPSGTLSAYTSATNYPNPNNYTYIEY